MNGGMDENNDVSNALAPEHANQQRRALFDEAIASVDDRLAATAMEEAPEDQTAMQPTTPEENPSNKALKRKVVSFSTMPSEKKVADGNEEDLRIFIFF